MDDDRRPTFAERQCEELHFLRTAPDRRPRVSSLEEGYAYLVMSESNLLGACYRSPCDERNADALVILTRLAAEAQRVAEDLGLVQT